MLEQIEGERLLPEGKQHLLLAGGAAAVAVVVAGPGVLEDALAVHMLPTGREIDPHVLVIRSWILVVADRIRDIERHAADGIDDLDETVEVDLGEVIDVDPEIGLDRPHHESRTTARHVGVGIAERVRGIDLVRAEAGDDDLQVARDREHPRRLRDRVDIDQDDGIGAGVVVLALVDAEQEKRQAAGAIPIGDGAEPWAWLATRTGVPSGLISATKAGS